MFRHIVMLTLRDDTTEAQRRALLEGLATLPGRIASIRGYSVGVDVGLADGNASVSVVGDFDDRDGYLEYRDHEAHREVIAQFIAPVLVSRTALQHEMPGS